MDQDNNQEKDDAEGMVVYDFEEKKLDEEGFARKLNQPKLNRHEMDEMFLFE